MQDGVMLLAQEYAGWWTRSVVRRGARARGGGGRARALGLHAGKSVKKISVFGLHAGQSVKNQRFWAPRR